MHSLIKFEKYMVERQGDVDKSQLNPPIHIKPHGDPQPGIEPG
jgi:hypothetical protein